MKTEAKKPNGGKATEAADAHANGKLKAKDYDKEMKKLHVELVKLQEWVVAQVQAVLQLLHKFVKS